MSEPMLEIVVNNFCYLCFFAFPFFSLSAEHISRV